MSLSVEDIMRHIDGNVYNIDTKTHFTAPNHVVVPASGTKYPATLQELGMRPKPVPSKDEGILPVSPKWDCHVCLENNFHTPGDLYPFVMKSEDNEFYPLFPGCRHRVSFDDPLDVLVHIYQEHLGRISKEYYCMKCANDIPNNRLLNAQFGKLSEAKRHVKTENNGAKFECKVCGYRAKRKDALDTHKKTKHNLYSSSEQEESL